ncbi:MerR family transcriptional regulator [Microlunatus speluncae]|uniref:MerR family transcriptional regulator n=1 Tax=Microlunatus speluncae TaxID=2594267 RepID=UPI0012665422|nr:MerR family transcriptional regulator [Microlunatus speluncae]
MDEPYLLAGRFGAETRLSPKALRLYAELGLLVPSQVDVATGYRYYHRDQVARARLIGRLRQLDVPLARIAVLVELTPGALEIELRAWLKAQHDQLDRQAQLVDTIVRGGELPELVDAVRVRRAEPINLLCRQRLINTAELEDFQAEAEAEIRAALRAAGHPGDGPTRTYFHELVTPDSGGLVEVAVGYQGSLEPVAGLRIRLSPAQTEAVLPAPRTFEDFPLVLHLYDAVEAWINARPGVRIADTCFEVQPGTDARFDVVFPIHHPDQTEEF